MNTLALIATIFTISVLIFYISERYISLGHFSRNFLSGMYDAENEVDVLEIDKISAEDFTRLLNDIIRAFANDHGSPKIKMFFEYERHKESYAKMFQDMMMKRQLALIDHLTHACQEKKTTLPTLKMNCNSFPFGTRYQTLARSLELENPPLILQHPLVYIYLHYQKEMNEQDAITPAEVVKKFISNNNQSSETIYQSIVKTCNLCGKVFSSVISPGTTHEDLAYLVSKTNSATKIDISSTMKQLEQISEDVENFWNEVNNEIVEEVLKHPAIEGDLLKLNCKSLSCLRGSLLRNPP